MSNLQQYRSDLRIHLTDMHTIANEILRIGPEHAATPQEEELFEEIDEFCKQTNLSIVNLHNRLVSTGTTFKLMRLDDGNDEGTDKGSE